MSCYANFRCPELPGCREGIRLGRKTCIMLLQSLSAKGTSVDGNGNDTAACLGTTVSHDRGGFTLFGSSSITATQFIFFCTAVLGYCLIGLGFVVHRASVTYSRLDSCTRIRTYPKAVAPTSTDDSVSLCSVQRTRRSCFQIVPYNNGNEEGIRCI